MADLAGKLYHETSHICIVTNTEDLDTLATPEANLPSKRETDTANSTAVSHSGFPTRSPAFISHYAPRTDLCFQVCVNLNPKPFIIGEPMPDWVLCSFCKRTSTDGDKVASESAAAPDTALEVLQSRDEVWVFDCNHEDGMQDLDLVRKCSLKHQVSCSVEGSLVSNEAEVSEQCQRSCLCYRRSVWV